jgi:hypothetical protein
MVMEKRRRQRPGKVVGGVLGRMMEESRYLSAADRVVVAMLGNKDLRQNEMAQILGVPESTLCRRIKRIWRRLDDPIVRALIEQRGELREDVWQLGIEHFLHGLSFGELAEKHRMSERQVGKFLWLIRGWFNGRQSRPRRPREEKVEDRG